MDANKYTYIIYVNVNCKPTEQLHWKENSSASFISSLKMFGSKWKMKQKLKKNTWR